MSLDIEKLKREMISWSPAGGCIAGWAMEIFTQKQEEQTMEIKVVIDGQEVKVQGTVEEITTLLKQINNKESLWAANGNYKPVSGMSELHLMRAIAWCYRTKAEKLKAAAESEDLTKFKEELEKEAGASILERFPLSKPSNLIEELESRLEEEDIYPEDQDYL